MKKSITCFEIQDKNFLKSEQTETPKSNPSGVFMSHFVKSFNSRVALLCTLVLLLANLSIHAQNTSSKVFRAGAATSNITPKIGTSINGNMKDVTIKQIHDETHARCIVLDDGQTRLALVTVDLCMIYREELDEAKRRVHQITGIPIENMMMSAIHTHSGETACSVFQSDPDKEYLKFLTERIADAVIRANNNLAPARIGWTIGNEPTQVFNPTCS